MQDLTRILVPIDFSALSSWTVRWVAGNMKQAGSSLLYLLHVQDRLPDVGYLLKEGARQTDRRLAAAETKMTQWVEEVPSPVRAIPIFGFGDIAEAIARSCRQQRIEMVVMTKHTMTGFVRFFRSSVTESVARSVNCPVVILRFRDTPNFCFLTSGVNTNALAPMTVGAGEPRRS